ncbi:MAG: polysaccharide pyruvyl transferase family protein [Candidatus Bathyarchaeia archaeon]
MTNILLINTNCSWNKGSAAQVVSTVETLRKVIPNSRFTLVSINCPDLDAKLCSRYGVNVVGFSNKSPFSRFAYVQSFFRLSNLLLRSHIWSSFNNAGIDVDFLISENVLEQYHSSDLVIDLAGDSFSDHGAFSIFPLLYGYIAVAFKKKIVVYSQSIGPFKKVMNPIAKIYLNKADLVVVRENETIEILKKIGFSNVKLAAEIAFAMKPASQNRIEEIFAKEKVPTRVPIVGIGTNELIYKLYKSNRESYLSLTAKMADYIVEHMGAQVLLIPHVIIPEQYAVNDDRYISKLVLERVKHKEKIKMVTGDYSPEELKGIIGQCSLFIGSRMHSNIASLSMCVPVVALGWSHKYKGIMEMAGQGKYSMMFKTARYTEIIQKLDEAWKNRAAIRAELESTVPVLEASVLDSGLLIRELLDLNL